MMLSVLAEIFMSLPLDSMLVTRRARKARPPLTAGATPSTTPCTMLPAGNGAMEPTTTASLTVPLQLLPGVADSELICAPTLILTAVPAGTVTPGAATGAGVVLGRGLGVV